MGPTEFRILAIIANTVLAMVPSITQFTLVFYLFGKKMTLMSLDIFGILVFLTLLVIYLGTIAKDAHDYAEMDPMPGE